MFKKLFFLSFAIACLSVLNVKAQDNTDKIKDGINKVYEMFNSGDFSDIGKYIDAGYVEHTPTMGQKPGLEGFVEVMKSFKKSFPDMKFTINDVIITNDKAAVLNTMTGTNTGEFMGMPATNKKISVMGIDWLLFNKDPKCTEHWGYIDSYSMMQQLGMNK